MKLFSKSAKVFAQKILSVTSNEGFANLLEISQNKNELVFELSYKLDLRTKVKNVLDYEKLILQVKTKNASRIATTVTSNLVKDTIQKKVNPFNNNLQETKIVKPLPGTRKTVYPKKVSEKVYSGIKITNDFSVKDDVILEKVVNINSSLIQTLSSVYSYVDLHKPDFKQEEIRPKRNTGNDSFDPGDVVSFVNKHLFPLSQYEESFFTRQIPQSLIFDYITEKVSKKPNDADIVVYEPVIKNEVLQEVVIPIYVNIPSEYRDLNLEVVCSLYKIDSNVPDEVVSNDLHVSSYVDGYESLNFNLIPNVSVNSYGQSDYYVTISLSRPEMRSKISGYNLYSRVIEKSGNIGEFKPHGSIRSIVDDNPSESFWLLSSNAFQILRVVPVYKNSKESHVFRDVILGSGYSAIGNLVITVDTSSATNVNIYNIPKEAVKISLYQRICNSNGAKFNIIKQIPVDGKTKDIRISVPEDVTGDYEYFATASVFASDSSVSEDIVSNCVSHRVARSLSTQQKVNVSIENVTKSLDSYNPNFSFDISTRVETSTAQKTVNEIQKQINDFYNKYLNPQNLDNTATTGDQEQNYPGVPKYNDLFFHEVIRTNLSTGDREVFDLVGETTRDSNVGGTFEDSNETRLRRNIKPLDPQDTYLYQVYTYAKKPATLFRNFIAHGTNSKREWFYLPYKWLNSIPGKEGMLLPADKDGLPVVTDLELLKSETFGLTAEYKLENIKDQVEINQVVADRISRKIVKISWNVNITSPSYSTQISPYDSYMVMAIVNGKKKYLGMTRSTFAYHELESNNGSDLSSNDYGSVYYVVIPVLKSLNLDSPAYSNDLIIDPVDLHPRTKVTNTLLQDRYKQYEARNRDEFRENSINFSKLSLQENSRQDIKTSLDQNVFQNINRTDISKNRR